MIISKPMDGNNYSACSGAMIITLGANEKFGFTVEKCKKPKDEETREYELWKKTDYMVQSWILSSISKDMTHSFLHASSAEELC